jgi:vacuole morphology and inheritance protein 14
MSNSEIIPQNIIKNLTDKRNQGAEELEALIKKFQGNKENENISSAVLQVCKLTKSVQPNLRKAGLWAISAICVALMKNCKEHLKEIIPSLFLCMKDQDPKVRFHCCEAMYNVAKAARGYILEYFPNIFISMCKLSSDSDNTVKNANTHLNRLIKDILTEDEGFNLEDVIPLIEERVNSTDPYLRQFLLGWINLLDSIPDLNVLLHLPRFLSGIFSTLSDPNTEIVTQAQSTLKEFMNEITENSKSIDIIPLMKIVLSHCFSQDNLTRETAQSWMNQFILLRGEDLISFDNELIEKTVSNLSHKLESIKTISSVTEKNLIKLIKNTKKQIQYDKIIQTLSTYVETSPLQTRIASLNWINLLIKKDFDEIMKHSESLLSLLTDTLTDPSEEVLILSLEILSFIARSETTFSLVFLKIMLAFKNERKLLTKSGFIVRKLSVMLNPEKIYCEFAKDLLKEEDFDFSSSFIQILNTILLTCKEFAELRQKIKQV